MLKDARHFRRALLEWFRREARDLPWRRTRDPYRVWLSEVILQQTRVDQALPYYERILAALPTVHDLAAAPPDRVLKLWEGLGYYTRARNLHRAARAVVES
ncbi:MAG TPA: A/G-specific adenine glycosylase, partial [Candidatus Hydrogenedentes bacterium]|nr:A/G-specific adenine glycosylase [Candidatus Hydrogenedentota bacterium]